ncbi:MAG: hypothetical protein QM774_02695 [Gordonia sp. (in: high G+C Gram-positive bacteria)]|uniref:hypothetical protein n=1 Tax=Gordonia sp. (in: high G+C Gram-positive bacteria) TaxID=84139 RepID=UPI0039E2F501
MELLVHKREVRTIGAAIAIGACLVASAAPAMASPSTPLRHFADVEHSTDGVHTEPGTDEVIDTGGEDLIAIDDPETPPADPMPVAPGALAQILNRPTTLWLASLKPDQAIKALPVPAQYRQSNDFMAAALKRELTKAVKTPGACIQLIFDPSTEFGLFDYGFWAIDRHWCPR